MALFDERQRNGVCVRVCMFEALIISGLSLVQQTCSCTFLHLTQRKATPQSTASNPGGGSSTAGRPTWSSWSAPAAAASSSSSSASCWAHKKPKLKSLHERITVKLSHTHTHDNWLMCWGSVCPAHSAARFDQGSPGQPGWAPSRHRHNDDTEHAHENLMIKRNVFPTREVCPAHSYPAHVTFLCAPPYPSPI